MSCQVVNRQVWVQFLGLLLVCIGSHHLVGLVIKESASRAEDPGFESCLRRGFFRVESYQWLKNWLSSGYPARHLALGLVSPVSVYCDWARWKVWSATSISVWRHVQLSEQIYPWDTLPCCWDVEQPTKKQTLSVAVWTLHCSCGRSAVSDLDHWWTKGCYLWPWPLVNQGLLSLSLTTGEPRAVISVLDHWWTKGCYLCPWPRTVISVLDHWWTKGWYLCPWPLVNQGLLSLSLTKDRYLCTWPLVNQGLVSLSLTKDRYLYLTTGEPRTLSKICTPTYQVLMHQRSKYIIMMGQYECL